MRKVFILSICSFLWSAIIASTPNKKFIHFFEANVSSQNDHLSKKIINGANEIFSNAVIYNDVNSKLNSFNDTANVNFNVFCGRVFLDYDRIDWDYSPGDKTPIQEAFKKIKAEEGYTGNIDNTLFLDVLRGEYNKYLINVNGKPSVLFIYIETYEYDLTATSSQTSKWKKRRIYGFVDKNLPQQEQLKINYVKSLWGQIKPTIQVNAESKPDPQYVIQAYVNKYIQEHSKTIVQPNPNCNACPINPKPNTDYWDDKGRLWRYTKTNCGDTNWVDLSYEFSNIPCGNDIWKQNIDVQYVHEQYYNDKINFLKNYPLQHLAGGVTPELEKHLWQATQFATVYALKDDYVNTQVGWQGWIPFWGSALTGYYQASISNGDLVFQSQAGLNFIMAATDISLVKSLAQNVIKIGFKKWIIDGGIKIAAKNAWYRAGKGWASFKLGYQLRNAPIQGVTLYEKQLAQGIEVVEEATSKYIKYDKLNGDILIGKFSDNVEKDILFEKGGKLTNVPQNLTDEQLSDWLLTNADNLVISGGRYVANAGPELKSYLNSIINKPIGKTYNGKFYKSVGKNSELMHNAKPNIISEYSIEEAWGRYDTQGESGMYYSQTLTGNQTEMSFYSDWNSFSTYEYSNVQIDNMLDLTDDIVRQELGTEFNKLVLGMPDKSQAYEFTNIIGTWARQKNYKGLIVPGARGNKDYVNIIVFNQSDLNAVLGNLSPVKLK